LSYPSRIVRTRSGEIRIRFPEHERALLREVAARTRGRLATGDDDPALRRLFPPAYVDPDREREYRELTRGQLVTGRERALEVLETTVDKASLSTEEADAWLRALNDARLVLGTELDVQEDLHWDTVGRDDPRALDYAVYGYLSWIQEQLVAAAGL
jgi:Domain of unknown function (DUF2017)